MENNLHNLIETLFYEEDSQYVSIRKIYSLVKMEKENFDLDFDSFLDEVRKITEFEIIDLPIELNDLDEFNEYESLFQEYGEYGGPYITRAHQETSHDEYVTFLTEKVQQLIIILENLKVAKQDKQDVDSLDEINMLLDKAYIIEQKISTYRQHLDS